METNTEMAVSGISATVVKFTPHASGEAGGWYTLDVAVGGVIYLVTAVRIDSLWSMCSVVREGGVNQLRRGDLKKRIEVAVKEVVFA